jgi:hypothetical protein
MKRVMKKYAKYLHPSIQVQLQGKKRSYKNSLPLCISKNFKELPRFEELLMLMFSSLVEPKMTDIPTEFSEEEIQQVKDTFSSLGFSTPQYLDIVAKQILEHSSNKKANEMYAWGSMMRREDDRLHKRTVAAIIGLSVLGGALFVSAVY